MTESVRSVWDFGRSTTYLRNIGRRYGDSRNVDKQARIFDYADYGIIQDVSIF